MTSKVFIVNPKIIVIIDCGHGGIDDNGIYTTRGKQFKFPDGSIAYEGVYNRLIGAKISEKLIKAGLETVYTVDPCDATDMSLVDRVKIEHNLQKDNYTTLFISCHSNAGGGRGFEIFTSVGQTKSDILATAIGEEIKATFPQIKFRTDTTDGDLDKESNFYVLKHTIGAAVLIENLFFDNREDFELLRSESFQNRVSEAISTGILNYSNKC